MHSVPASAFSRCLQLGMRAISWICVLLSGSSIAQHFADYKQDERMSTVRFLRGRDDDSIDSSILPECARSCQMRFPINVSTACTHDQVFTSPVTRCVQQSCPKLQEVLDWQTHYASICDLKARDQETWETTLSWALFGVATLTVIGRLLSRSQWLQGPGFWWDDWLVLVLWVLSIELAVCLNYVKGSGTGRDAIGVIDTIGIDELLMWVYITVPFYIIEIYGAKIVWVALYMRVWDFNGPFRKLCWATIFILMLPTIFFSIGAIVVFWPMHYYVDDSPIARQFHLGINILATVYSVAAINIAMDFWVLLLPVPKLMSLTGVSKQKKASICAVFLLGFGVTAISVVRLRYIIPLKNTTNVTWDFGCFGAWSQIEAHLSVVSCNLPAIAGLINRLRIRRRASRNVEGSSGTGSSNFSDRKPPKTPRLNTWTESSACTSEEGRSEDEYEQIALRHAPTMASV